MRADLYRLERGRLVPGSPTYLPSTSIQNFLMRSRVYHWIADHSNLYGLLRERGGLAARRLFANVERFRLRFDSAAAASDPDERNERTNQYSAALATALLQKSMQEVEKTGSDFVVVDDTRPRFASERALGHHSIFYRLICTVQPKDRPAT